MFKNTFFKNTFILIIGGMLTKILGFIIKIIYTRYVGEAGVALYTIVLPTYSLLLCIAQLGLPIAISKLVAEEKRSSKKIVFSIIPLMLILNLILIVIVWFTSPFIASNLLQQPQTAILLKSIVLTLPFVSISAILKGYFFGKQKMHPNTISNIIEQLIRLVAIFIVIPYLLTKSVIAAIAGLILINILSEIAQIVTYLFFLPKGITINKTELKVDKEITKDIISLSLPTVSSRFIGNIGYFFEPIILTNLMLYSGYTSDYILLEYGIFNGYSLQLLTLPGFFTMAISSALIPEISKHYSNGNIKQVKKRFKQAIGFSLFIGLAFGIVCFFFGKIILSTIYGSANGFGYVKFLLPFFVLFYIEGPLISTLQAIGEAKTTLKITFFGMILKLAILAIGSVCHIGIYGLIISEIINIIFVVGFNFKYIKKLILDKK